MKCTYCNIEVGSNAKVCPLCQSALVGEKEEEYWPTPKELKHHSIIWKCFLFICLVGSVVCLFSDFLFDESTHFHWSVILVAWIIVFAAMLARFIKNHRIVPRIIFETMIAISVMIVITGWYCGFTAVSVNIIMPILCSVALVVNFIFSFIDAGFTKSALFYLLLNIVVGVTPYIALLIHSGKAPIAWSITLLISVITFIGLAVFRGKAMLSEVHRRLHI